MLQGAGYLPVSDVINGSLVSVTPGYATNPAAFGPSPISNSMYSAVPTLPPYSSGSGQMSVGAGGSDVANMPTANAASANPFNMKVSPLLWSLIFIAVAIAGLRFIHWRG